MNLLSLFRKPNPASELSRLGHQQYRQRVRDKVDEMRRDLGMKPAKWGR